MKQILPKTIFSYPKSLYTVIEAISAVVKEDKSALVLDFFAGSGTTGHALMEINKDGGNRKFILVEQMDYVKTETLARVVAIQNKLQSDNSIVYCELAKQNQQFVEEIEAAADDETLKEIYSRIIETGYISAKVEPQEINSAAEDFNNLDIDDKNDY